MSQHSSMFGRPLLDTLTQPGFRLPNLIRWLQDEVWTMGRYQSMGEKPSKYLSEGEALVHGREKILTLAGDSIYDGLAASPSGGWSMSTFLVQNPGASVVVV